MTTSQEIKGEWVKAPSMTKDELLALLNALETKHGTSYDAAHEDADEALLAYINDPDITAAFDPEGLWWYS